MKRIGHHPANWFIALNVGSLRSGGAVSPETWRQPGRRERAKDQRDAAGRD